MENNDKKNKLISRRQFLTVSFTLAGGVVMGAKSIFDTSGALKNRSQLDSLINGVQIGVITYSYRSRADQSAEGLLEDIVNSGISAVELMGEPVEQFAGKPESPVDLRVFKGLQFKQKNGDLTSDEEEKLSEMESKVEPYIRKVADWRENVSMDNFRDLRKIYNDAGVDIYAWKPDVFAKNNTDEEVSYGFRVAKALGAESCTAEHPGDDEQTKRLGGIAAKHQIYMSYHAHTQATPTLWDTALEQSEYNAINFDVGHYVAAGNPDPLEFIEAKHDRITSMHLKDRTTPDNGKKNLSWGDGDTPIVEILNEMHDQAYDFPATVELEYEIPEDSDSVKEVSNCLDFCRDALQN